VSTLSAAQRLRQRVLLASFVVLGVGLGGSSCTRPQADGAGWNLLLVTLDTTRADRLGAYGYAAAETPNLDRLAAAGLRFDQAWSPAPLTLPAHATLLTGLLPVEHGVRRNGDAALPDEVPTLATVLAGAGYRTAAFVGAFVLDHRFGLGRGFGHYDDDVERDPRRDQRLEAERPAGAVADAALAWLDAAGAGQQPFFLWVHLYDPHAPYRAPEPFAGRHAEPYDAELAYADAAVGRLLAALDERGLTSRTVVAVAGDHGEALGEHGESTHGVLLYEASLRVPLILRAPGVLPAGRQVATPVGLADVAPSLAGLLAVPWPRATPHGRDLSAALAGGGEPPPADLYAETRYPELFGWQPLAALRRGRYKLIQGVAPELYDLERDPGERHDLAADERRLARRLSEALAAVAAAAPASDPAPVDAETRARLASLGYASGPAAANASARDPRRMVGLMAEYEEAQALLDQGREDAARARLENLLAADPANPVFRTKLAGLWRAQGELERAIPLYRQAVAARPADAEGWYNLAITLQEAGHGEEALEAIRQALELAPERAEAVNALGIVLAAAGELEDARRAFARAAGLDPENARFFHNLGNVLRDLGRLDEAAEAYRRALERAPDYPDALNGLGALEVERDRPHQALTYFDRALALAPEQHEIRLNRAVAHQLAGERAAAIADYRDFLRAVGDDPAFARQRQLAQTFLARLGGAPAQAPAGSEAERPGEL